jgi:tetratricopeptide (TPR) repeat protein
MKIRWWHHLLVVSAVLTFGAQIAFAGDLPFTDISLTQAKTQAATEKKLLLIDFTATWCGPCKKMEKTTWSDPTIVDWLKKNAICLQVDVDKQKDLSKSMHVSAMPTVVVFNLQSKSDEFDRQIGYQEPGQLLDWLEAVQAGKNSLDVALDKLKRVQGKGGETEVNLRLDVAKRLTNAGRFDEAAEQYAWLWTNIPQECPPMIGVRSSFMASDMTQLVKQHPDSKKRFEQLRAEADGPKTREDWITLNTVLGEDDKTLAWFDQAKKDPAQLAFLEKADFLLEPILFDHDRYSDIADYLYKDPQKVLNDKYEFAKQVIQFTGAQGEKFDPFPKDAATIYGCYLAAGRDAAAAKIATECFAKEDTPEMHRALANIAYEVNHVEPIHLQWLDIAAGTTNKDARYYCRKGLFYARLKQYDDALKNFDEAIKQAQFPFFYTSRAAVYSSLKQYDKAIADLTRAIELEPSEALFRDRGVARFCANQNQEALDDFDHALTMDPSDSYSQVDRSAVFYKEGKYQDAYDAACKAISIDPKNKSGFCNRGEASYKLGKYDDALADLNEAVQLENPMDKGEAYYFRSRVYEKLGKSDLAAADKKMSDSLGFKPEEND